MLELEIRQGLGNKIILKLDANCIYTFSMFC